MRPRDTETRAFIPSERMGLVTSVLLEKDDRRLQIQTHGVFDRDPTSLKEKGLSIKRRSFLEEGGDTETLGDIFEFEERFKVDRKKLESMILRNMDNLNMEAEDFFRQIENDTNTTVIWPSRLKIGAKSKKDPHIRIGGGESEVKEAKARIIEYLDGRFSRVTMKMDVSFTDHSHVIGKNGNTIRRVMAETTCHIHFPDSNRNNPCEKSNQVSIAGEIGGSEKARCRIRELTPLVFTFELSIAPQENELLDPNDPYIKTLQNQYNIQVMFRQKLRGFPSTNVLVKGSEWECSRVKEATTLLIGHLNTLLPSIQKMDIVVSMILEISPQHHATVLGKNNTSLQGIMKRTNTRILFPDASDPNIPTIRKGTVTILGSIHNVYLARQQLLGSLPLVLMFDLPDDNAVDETLIHAIQEENNVSINIKPKVRQGTRAAVIKAQERNANGIYIARARLLGLPRTNVVEADIPETYKIPPEPIEAPKGVGIFYHPSGCMVTGGYVPTRYYGAKTGSYCYTPNQGTNFSTPYLPAPQNIGIRQNHPILHEYACRVLDNLSRLQEEHRHEDFTTKRSFGDGLIYRPMSPWTEINEVTGDQDLSENIKEVRIKLEDFCTPKEEPEDRPPTPKGMDDDNNGFYDCYGSFTNLFISSDNIDSSNLLPEPPLDFIKTEESLKREDLTVPDLTDEFDNNNNNNEALNSRREEMNCRAIGLATPPFST